MTERDPMPFGKYKGTPISEVPDSYKEWLCEQPGFKEKNPTLYKLFDEGDGATSTPKEVNNINVEYELLKSAPVGFEQWWRVTYGERLRKDGELVYIPMLRVALTTWRFCFKIKEPEPKPVQTTQPPMFKKTAVVTKPLDEDVPF